MEGGAGTQRKPLRAFAESQELKEEGGQFFQSQGRILRLMDKTLWGHVTARIRR